MNLGNWSLKKWSFNKKIMAFGFSLAIGGFTIFGFYLLTMNTVFKVQNRYKDASEVHRLLSELKMDYSKMTLSLLEYMNNPSPEAWAKKERADADAEEHFNEARYLSFNPDLDEYLGVIGTFDHEHLHALDAKAKYMADNRGSMKLDPLKWWIEWYQPTYEQVQTAIWEAAMITENDQEIAYQEQRDISIKAAVIMGVSIFIGTLIGFLLSRQFGKMVGNPLVAAIERLNTETTQTRQSVSSISGASQQLAESTSEQAAALQETAASVEEMSAMINKSADNAKRSGAAATASSEVASKGKQASDEMMKAIHDINESNTSIMRSIEESNQKITDITRVIAEIGNKTKIINDIVFQTKLLSFNASVEAARAGEHGKGFAVVAEEVGNLAQMSGNAAKEIAEMLNASIEKVEGIVSETKSKVERLIAEGRIKVETGTKIAEQNGKVLQEIVEQVGKVNMMINEIATASHEQAQGVGEITKAMGQLDQVTQQNSGVSQQVASAAEQLSAQAGSLGVVVQSLEAIVWGEREEGASASEAKAREKKQKKGKVAKSAPPKEEAADAKVVPIRKAAAHTTAYGEEGLPAESDPRFKEV